MSFLNEGGVPIGLPGDVEDFKDLLNSLDFFASFFIKKKRRGKLLNPKISKFDNKPPFKIRIRKDVDPKPQAMKHKPALMDKPG